MATREAGAMRWTCALMLAVAVFGSAGAQTSSPVKDDLFAGTEKFANGASDVTEVTMDPDTLDMVGGKDAKRAHSMVLNVVRTYEYPKPGMYNIADVEAIRQRLNTGDWHCSVHTRDLKHGESTDICYKRRTDGMVDKAIITVEPKELTFIHQIRRENRDGGSLDGGGISGFSDLSGLPPAAMFALMRPEMNAEIQVAMAEMRAHGTEMMHAWGALQNTPGMQQPPEQLKSMPETSPEGMKRLQEQIEQMPKVSPEEMKRLEKQLRDTENKTQP